MVRTLFYPGPLGGLDPSRIFASAVLIRMGRRAGVETLDRYGHRALFIATGAVVYFGAVLIAAKYRLPAMWGQRAHVEAGGLMVYAADWTALYRRAAYFVDRILKGANPPTSLKPSAPPVPAGFAGAEWSARSS